MNDDTFVIVPAYNEANVLGRSIADVSKYFKNIVCINDGSVDNTEEVIKNSPAILISHPYNLGQGAALQTGLEYALLNSKAKYFVTFDADGQHSIKDAVRLLKYIRKHKVDVVLGSRFLGNTQNASKSRTFILKIAVKFSNLLSGIKLTDAHNGLRVFNRNFAENLNITMPDMAHASEIIHRISQNNFTYSELPVTIKYTKYSKSKGQSVMNMVNIAFDLLIQKLSKQ